MKKPILEVEHVQKIYESHGYGLPVLNDISLTIFQGDFVAIMGPSGSGKTTLLNMISSIDRPTRGAIRLDGKDIARLNEKELSKLRKDRTDSCSRIIPCSIRCLCLTTSCFR